MRDAIFIVANADGVIRMTKRWPTLRREEIAVQIKITIPDHSFQAPVLTALLDIADANVIQPTVAIEVVEPPPADGALGAPSTAASPANKAGESDAG